MLLLVQRGTVGQCIEFIKWNNYFCEQSYSIDCIFLAIQITLQAKIMWTGSIENYNSDYLFEMNFSNYLWNIDQTHNIIGEV